MYMLNHITDHPRDIIQLTVQHFGISRQTANWHIRQLVEAGLISAKGNTKAREYNLEPLLHKEVMVNVTPSLEEDVVWRENILPLIPDLKENVIEICQYGFTEMLNNVIDHSEADWAMISIERNAVNVKMQVIDKGVGVFDKIQKELGLHDPRHALLELSKGKLTTDPNKHTGEGIFFTSRMFDKFSILSGSLYFSRTNRQGDDWLLEAQDRQGTSGTMVTMEIGPHAQQTQTGVFSRYASEKDEYGFTRTVVPIQLARYEGEQLLSRSQARRLLARVDRFKEVLLDFKGVKTIGQAFADEVFRVFHNEHPEIEIIPINTTLEIKRMIRRVVSGASSPTDANGQQQLF